MGFNFHRAAPFPHLFAMNRVAQKKTPLGVLRSIAIQRQKTLRWHEPDDFGEFDELLMNKGKKRKKRRRWKREKVSANIEKQGSKARPEKCPHSPVLADGERTVNGVCFLRETCRDPDKKSNGTQSRSLQ